MMAKDKIVAKACGRGNVSLKIDLSIYQYGSGIKISATQELLIQEARELAADLNRLADEAQAKIDKERAREERRKKWREREIAAGRMRVIDAGSFFGR